MEMPVNEPAVGTACWLAESESAPSTVFTLPKPESEMFRALVSEIAPVPVAARLPEVTESEPAAFAVRLLFAAMVTPALNARPAPVVSERLKFGVSAVLTVIAPLAASPICTVPAEITFNSAAVRPN